MDKDIKESREYRLAKDWEMAVNNYSFNPARFAAAIPTMHPTLQQSLYRLIKECIKVMADDSRRYDERNGFTRGSEMYHGVPERTREKHTIKVIDR